MTVTLAQSWTPAQLRFSRLIGRGRGQDMLSVHFNARTTQRSLMPLNVMLDGESLQAWVSPDEWLNWIQPLLALNEVDALPGELSPLVAAWALQSWDACCQQHGLSVPHAQSVGSLCCQEVPPCPMLTLQRAPNARLRLYLIDWPEDWLLSLLHSLPPLLVTDEPSVTVGVCAGIARLPLAALRTLAPGDLVLSAWAAALEEQHFLLNWGRPCCELIRIEGNRYRIGRLMTNLDDLLDLSTDVGETPPNDETAPCAVDDLPLTIYLEIGRTTVPVGQLMNLTEGQVLETDLAFSPQVALRVQGHVVGFGSLVRVGERLGVRINEMALQAK